jgi:hypothetical protein
VAMGGTRKSLDRGSAELTAGRVGSETPSARGGIRRIGRIGPIGLIDEAADLPTVAFRSAKVRTIQAFAERKPTIADRHRKSPLDP